jgi:hypothetical protein
MFVDRLPLAQREVLVARFVLDLTDTQIAELLSRSPESVRVLQHRALAFLRTRLRNLSGEGNEGAKARMKRCPDQAPVLRMRRWALY